MIPNRTTGGSSANDPPSVCVLGGGQLGVAVARRLRENGDTVTLVDELAPQEHAGLPETAVVHGDPSDTDVLEDAGLDHAETVVVATRTDSRNLLIAQLVNANFDADVVVLTNTPDRLDPIAQAGHEPVCATAVLSDALVNNV
jgi:trk system potassium uptake protein TrkA